MRTLNELLMVSVWAKDLTPEQMERVKAGITVRDFTTNSYIAHKGEPADRWIGVIEGLVKLGLVDRAGNTATLLGVPQGSWFGEGSVLKKEPRRYDVVALRDCRIAFMPVNIFFWLMETSLAFNRFLVMQLNERLSHFIGTLEHERLLDPDARVAQVLALMFNPHLHPVTETRLEISQEELGNLAGISRQRVNRALHLLEAAGLLKIEYGTIVIRDVNGLRNYGEQS
jgi:CRP/FNR family cyclic AMP-dependent transcriptional regulator